MITEIPRNKDCIIFGLKNIKNLKRYSFTVGAYEGLEIALRDGNIFLIRFESQSCQEIFSKRLVRLRKKIVFNLDYKGSLNPEKLFKLADYERR